MAGNGFVRVPGGIPDVAGEKVTQEYVGGAALVSDGGLLIADSCANVSVGTTAAYQDLATTTRSVTVTNYHATQSAWIGLGTSSESAADIVGTTGAEVGAIVPAGQSRTVQVHSGRTRLAYIGSGASTTINVAQGL